MMQRLTERNNAQQGTVATQASVLSVCAHKNSDCANTAAYSDTAYAVSFFAFYFYSFYFYYLRRQRKQAIAA
ncbi:MAG: hypothetical protein IKC97_09315 [Clostridia bacterium]|nr:hypothetical protein [Clostridia bacterium]